jgi:serine kinase of HPr protein (carbohydrate metabolism regulator)
MLSIRTIFGETAIRIKKNLKLIVELQRATAPGLAGSCLRSERVGGWRGPGPGPPVRSSGAAQRRGAAPILQLILSFKFTLKSSQDCA